MPNENDEQTTTSSQNDKDIQTPNADREPSTSYLNTPASILPSSDPYVAKNDTLNQAPATATKDNSLATAKAPKSKKKPLIIGLVLLLVIVVAAICTYFFWYQNPNKVVGDALGNVINAESVEADYTMTLENTEDDGTVEVSGIFKANEEKAQLDAKATVSGEIDFDVDASAIVDKDNTAYLKVNDVKTLVSQIIGGAEIGALPPSFDTLITKIDGNWIKITEKDLEEFTQGSTSENCESKALDKIRNDSATKNELRELYVKYPLITVVENLGSESASIGYVVEPNNENTKKFIEGVNNTTVYKELKTCDPNIEDVKYEDVIDEKNTDQRVEVWINRWTHELSKMTVSGTDDSAKYTFSTNPKFNGAPAVETPDEALTVQDLRADIEAVISDFFGGVTESTQPSSST